MPLGQKLFLQSAKKSRAFTEFAQQPSDDNPWGNEETESFICSTTNLLQPVQTENVICTGTCVASCGWMALTKRAHSENVS